MGISIQEFLSSREPCAVCEASGDQHHCITELLSRQDSCILYNSMGLNQDYHTMNDTALLQEMRATTAPDVVLDYYIRSERITRFINSMPNSDDVWNTIYFESVKPMLPDLRFRRTDVFLENLERLVENLELRYFGSRH